MRSRNLVRYWAATFVVTSGIGAALACSSTPELVTIPDLPPTLASAGGNAGASFKGPASAGTGATGFDSSPVVTAPHTPPPLSGGTLLALKAGGRAVVSDTDRDRIVLVDVGAGTVLADIALGAGAEPGRLVEDGSGRVHVLLRGTGEVVSIDVTSGAVLSRRSACKAPRGIAWDKASDQLVVACLEGSLVELPAAGGATTRVTALGSDLRDVTLLDGTLAVTRFRSAEVLFLDAARNIERTTKLAGDGNGLDADVAWRALAASDGTLAISHQRAFHGRIAVSGAGSESSGGSSSGGSSAVPHIDIGMDAGESSAGSPGVAGSGGVAGSVGAAGAGDERELPSPSGYGSVFVPCSSVVEATLSFIGTDGSVRTGPNLEGGVLPVDIATTSSRVAVAFAGAGANTGSVGVYELAQLAKASPSDCFSSESLASGSNVVAVAFDAKSGKLLVQGREPAELRVVDLDNGGTVDAVVALGGDSVFDTGHALFHTDSGGGIACASCHPEGTEDGRVWNFSDVGARRTQPLDVGLAGTAPFHWDGELSDFSALMDSIFVGRMGGPIESTERAKALEAYIYALPRRPAFRDASDAAAGRGKVLFESAATGCTTCQSGPNFSDGSSGDIGKGPALQVPSLIAVSARAPYMHDGCAATLLDRFDASCGGTAHGDVSTLTSADIADLVAYLETL